MRDRIFFFFVRNPTGKEKGEIKKVNLFTLAESSLSVLGGLQRGIKRPMAPNRNSGAGRFSLLLVCVCVCVCFELLCGFSRGFPFEESSDFRVRRQSERDFFLYS